MRSATDAAIHALPKAELHLHIEGAIPWDIVRSRAPTLPSPPPWWSADYRFDSFGHFTDALRQCYTAALTSPDDYSAAAHGIFAGLAAQNVRYVEISFSLGHALAAGIPVDEIIVAIKRAAPADMTVRVFCGVSRSRPAVVAVTAGEAILALPQFDGLDLHGDERAQGSAPFAVLFSQARQRGLATKAHAGELAGPDSLQDAIDALHLTRIEHGVHAIEDEALMTRLVAETITLDICPTSNIKLGAVEDIASHPIRRLHQRGVRVTVSTDNPMILGCTLTSELRLLVDRCGFALHDLAQLQRNAFRAALLPAAARTRILAGLDAVLAHTGDGGA